MTSENAADLRKLVYPETYFVGLAPAEIRLALLSRGIDAKAGRPFRYLELGFGEGEWSDELAERQFPVEVVVEPVHYFSGKITPCRS